MASKRKVRKRVAKALRKYVRGNAARRGSVAHREMLRRSAAHRKERRAAAAHDESLRYKLSRAQERLARMKGNPPRVKGRKTKGGRAVTLRNFTGTVVKKSDGTVQIVGRGRRK